MLQVSRRETGDSDRLLVQGIEGLFGCPQLIVAHDQAPAAQQGRQPALLGTVKGERHEQQLACLRVHGVTLGNGPAMHGNRAAGHGNALGLAGRAGGIDQVRQVVGLGAWPWPLRRIGLQGQLVQFQQHRHPGVPQPLTDAALGDEHGHGRVLDDPVETFTRVVDVQRHIGAAGLHHGIERHDHLDRTLQRHADKDFRPHPLGHQVLGQQ
ncbi:hypothetical protein D3C80_498780 [compost metagenome]